MFRYLTHPAVVLAGSAGFLLGILAHCFLHTQRERQEVVYYVDRISGWLPLAVMNAAQREALGREVDRLAAGKVTDAYDAVAYAIEADTGHPPSSHHPKHFYEVFAVVRVSPPGCKKERIVWWIRSWANVGFEPESNFNVTKNFFLVDSDSGEVTLVFPRAAN